MFADCDLAKSVPKSESTFARVMLTGECEDGKCDDKCWEKIKHVVNDKCFEVSVYYSILTVSLLVTYHVVPY